MVTKSLVVIVACLLTACGLAFENPQSWQDRANELAAEYGLPSGLPEPGPRPGEFECKVQTPIGVMTVTSEPDGYTGFLVILAGGTVQWGTVPMPENGIISVDLSDGTDVFLIGDLLYFNRATTRLGECSDGAR